MDASLRTTYLGQFEEDRAERIADELEQAGIAWYVKVPGRLSRIFFADAWGVRLFVDGSRIEEAAEVVRRSNASDDR